MASQRAAAADDDDDLDDLDELVDQFASPSHPTSSAPAPPPPAPATVAAPDLSQIPAAPSKASPTAATVEDDLDAEGEDDDLDEDAEGVGDEDFARDLAEGMDALFQSMNKGNDADFAKQFEALMRGDPDAMSALFEGAPPPTSAAATGGATATSAGVESTAGEGSSRPATGSFQDTVMSTMNKLKESDSSATAQSRSDDDMLAAMMEQLMGFSGGTGSDEDLQSMLQGFMDELMSKPIMYPPMKELNDKYPQWIASNRSTLPQADIDRYTTQSKVIADVVARFEDPGWDRDERLAGGSSGGAGANATRAKESLKRRQAEVTELMTKMQECGAPPKELLGDMPPGLDLGPDGMPNPENCCIS